MSKLKQFSAVIVLFATSMSANAGIPVIDGTAILNLILSYTKQVEQYAQQVQQYTTQLQQYQTAVNQLTAITGERGMGNLVNSQSLRQGIPSSIYLPANALTSITTNASTHTEQLAAAQRRIGQLASLIGAIETAVDSKASTDLQNRVAAENAFLLNEQIMIQAGKDHQRGQESIEAFNNRAAGSRRLDGTVAPF